MTEAPHSRLDTLLSQADLCVQHGELERASVLLEEARQLDAAQPQLQMLLEAFHSAQQRNATLERELRFAMAMMALLFFTGVWGFWRSAVGQQVQPAGSAMGAPVPSPPRSLASPPPSKAPAPTPRSSVAPRPAPARVVPRRAAIPPLPARRRRFSFRKALKTFRARKRLRRKRRRRRRARRKRRRRRRLRFGDPARHSEVPKSWCGPRRRYGPYYPCLRRSRRTRRCLRRSRRKKYGCLRIRK